PSRRSRTATGSRSAAPSWSSGGAERVPAFALTVMKFAFLALLYLFVYRAVRWFVVDMRASRVPASGADATSGMPPVPPAARGSAPVRRKGKAPRQLVIMDERGKKTQTVRLAG